MSRSESVVSIRPILPIENTNKTTQELFQNEVLRPILKFQNDVFLSCFKHSKQFQKYYKRIDKTNLLTKERGLKEFLKNNNKFRDKLYGMIIGMMAVTEYDTYMENESEYNRRIISMLTKRIVSQFDILL